MKKYLLHVIGSLVLVFGMFAVPAQAVTETPLPQCGVSYTEPCWTGFTVLLPGAGAYTQPDSHLVLLAVAHANAGYDDTLSVTIEADPGDGPLSQDIAEYLPVGSEVTFQIQTGSWQLNNQPSASGRLLVASQQGGPNNWVTTVAMRTTNWAFIAGCSPNLCTGDLHDLASQAGVSFIGLPTNPQQRILAMMMDGVRISTNVSAYSLPSVNETTGVMTFPTIAPAKTSSGATNWLFFNMFVPDSLIFAAFGITGVKAVENATAMNSTNTTGFSPIWTHEDSEEGVYISFDLYTLDPDPDSLNPTSRSGLQSKLGQRHALTGIVQPAGIGDRIKSDLILRFLPLAVTPAKVSTPGKAKILTKAQNCVKAKNKKKCSLVKSLTLTAKSLSNTTSFQGSCTKGKVTKLGTGPTSTRKIKVLSLSKGTWACKIRGKNHVGSATKYGKWSTEVSVRIR